MPDPAPAEPVVDEEDRAEAAHAPAWVPTLLLHILYPQSRKVGLGWTLFILASIGFLGLHKADGSPKIDAQMWFSCVLISAVLIGAGTVADAFLKLKGQGNALAS